MKSAHRRPIIAVLVFCLSAITLLTISPASADDPEETLGVVCGVDIDAGGTLGQDGSLNGEVWECKYDHELETYYWDKRPNLNGEPDSQASSYFSAGGVSNRVLSYTENLTGGIKSGGRVSTQWWYGANGLALRSILYNWNGSSWSTCRDTNWQFSGSTKFAFGRTFNWGSACGYNQFYASYNWGGENYSGSSWNGGWVWSGYIYANCFFCLSAQGDNNSPPPSVSPPPPPPVPKGKLAKNSPHGHGERAPR